MPLEKIKTRTNFSSTWIQCGMYLWSVSLLLSVMQMKNQSYRSSSEVVTPKMQAF